MVRVVTILIIHHQFAVADIPRNLEIRRIGAGIGIVKVIVDNLIVPQYIQADIIIAGCILPGLPIRKGNLQIRIECTAVVREEGQC